MTQFASATNASKSTPHFIEQEFQQTGSVVYRMYRSAYGTLSAAPTRANITYAQFIADRALLVGDPGLAQSTIDFANNFVQRPAFSCLSRGAAAGCVRQQPL